jgi:alcohol dehydrogenase class IV
MTFQYLMPTRLLYGAGSLSQLGEEAKRLGSRPLLVSDRGLQKVGLIDRPIELLRAAGLEVTVYADMGVDPDGEVVAQGAELAHAQGCDLVVGIGGGSPMCAAKAIAIVATNGGAIRDYEGFGKFQQPTLPVIAIPTTAGSGTEVSAVTIISDNERHIKMAIGSPLAYPRLAILDAELLLSLPPRQAAASGVDALSHAIEAFLTTQATPLTDALALGAIELLAGNLRTVISGPEDKEPLLAREACLLGASMANVACGNARLGLNHALTWPISSLFGVPHGLANGIMLPYTLEYTLPAAVGRFARLAAALGEPVDAPPEQLAPRAVRAVKRLLADLEFPRSFTSEQVDPAAIPQMVTMLQDGIYALFTRVNLRPSSPEDLTRLYERSFQGWEME